MSTKNKRTLRSRTNLTNLIKKSDYDSPATTKSFWKDAKVSLQPIRDLTRMPSKR